jgi:hypothetical protein
MSTPMFGEKSEIVITKEVNYLTLILLYNMDIGEHTLLIHVFFFSCSCHYRKENSHKKSIEIIIILILQK